MSLCICPVGMYAAPGIEHRLIASLPFILVSQSDTIGKCCAPNVFKTVEISERPVFVNLQLALKFIAVHLTFKGWNLLFLHKGVCFYFVMKSLQNHGNPNNSKAGECHYGFDLNLISSMSIYL